jgi:glycosyltransferase involved in cell wall biosynthesis
MCIVAFIFIIFIIIRTLVFGDPTSGWPSMVCIMLMIGGIQLFCMGIIGQYLAKTYLESKNRPVYILAENSLKN